jgi:hypothetical protein
MAFTFGQSLFRRDSMMRLPSRAQVSTLLLLIQVMMGVSNKQVCDVIAGTGEQPLLLYAGSCQKCRLLSRLVVALSLNNIRRVPLEKPEWRKFYYEDFPQAKGYPVLFLGGRPVFGLRVFMLVPVTVVYGWMMAVNKRFRRSS